jgi:MYXO-CTERM domain-containing protein
MKRFARRTLVTAAFVLVTSPAAAAPKPMINYFQPMPIVGKLSTTVWGASTVGPRDPANGLEDNGATGGVGPQQETNFYWDGKILFGNDGKYHLYATHWSHSNGFGPPGGGSTGWKNSIPMEAISDNVMGPYVSQGNCYTKNLEGNDMGHNLTALIAPTGTSPYTLSVGEIVPGQMFSSSSPNGPWTSLGLSQTTTNGHSGCGSTSSNFTFTVGHDNRFWATSRAGCVMDSDQVLGPYKIETDSVLPNLENNDNHDAEDECIWYSGGYYHIVFNYWPVQRAYHIMSKDGINSWTSTGLAYQAAQTPANANSNWLRYTDGTVNVWHNMERVGVIVENGHPTHFTFAVTDVNKNVTGISQGGSKILVVPFNGVQFDCDNGDQTSCDEVATGGGTGGTGGLDGGAGGSGGRTGGGGGIGGGTGGSGGTNGSGGTSGGSVSGGTVAGGGTVGSGGASAATGGRAQGGNTSSGGATSAGGIPALGGAVSSGGGGATGGNPVAGGGGLGSLGGTGGSGGVGGSSSDKSSGGGSGTGGSGVSANGGNSGSGGSSTTGGSTSSGCSCRIGNAAGSSGTLLLVGLVAAVVGLRIRKGYQSYLRPRSCPTGRKALERQVTATTADALH